MTVIGSDFICIGRWGSGPALRRGGVAGDGCRLEPGVGLVEMALGRGGVAGVMGAGWSPWKGVGLVV